MQQSFVSFKLLLGHSETQKTDFIVSQTHANQLSHFVLCCSTEKVCSIQFSKIGWKQAVIPMSPSGIGPSSTHDVVMRPTVYLFIQFKSMLLEFSPLLLNFTRHKILRELTTPSKGCLLTTDMTTKMRTLQTTCATNVHEDNIAHF